MQVPLHYEPRNYQREALTALDAGCVMNIWCWARRGGKDLTAFAHSIRKMIETPMNVVLVFPTQKQGYKSFWINIENDGFKTLDHIPKELIASQTNSETNMIITLKNGSTFQVLGATDPDALRGANGKIYIFSEFVDIPNDALDVIRPIIAVNGGQIIVQSTPKIDGVSGGTFKILFDRAKKTANQFASLITAHEYLSDEVLEDLRQEIIAKYGNDFKFRQEYLCDWGQAGSQSYYGAVLQALAKSEKIASFPYQSAHPAYTAWDLGVSDSTAITFFQYIQKKPRIIDYHETHDIGYDPIVKFLQTKPYNMAWHFIPHDGSVREASDATQRIYKLQDAGLVNSSLLTREGREDGIRRSIEQLMFSEINEPTTVELRRKLQLYKRKFNPITGDYEGPEHKTESHAADSVRGMFTAIEQYFDKETGEFLYSPENSQDSYESNLVTTPNLYRPNY